MSSTTKSVYLSSFNNQFTSFIEDILEIFPDNADILAAKKALALIRKANPRMIVIIWKQFIVDKYKEKIKQGDISFFISKDYSEDLTTADNQAEIMKSINRLREPIKNMSLENQAKAMKYIQNLTTLCDLYCDA